MEEQVSSGQVPMQPQEPVPPSNVPIPGQITPEQLEMMKARAKELAIQQALMQQRAAVPTQPGFRPNVVYVRRNLTVAELLLIVLLACGLVTGVQAAWNFSSNLLPKIEIKVK